MKAPKHAEPQKLKSYMPLVSELGMYESDFVRPACFAETIKACALEVSFAPHAFGRGGRHADSGKSYPSMP